MQVDSVIKMNLDKYSVLKVPAPTYLQDILKIDQVVTLIHGKKGKSITEDESFQLYENNDNTENALDLTGNPLQVDLKGDCDIEDVSFKATQPDNWTLSEQSHYPVCISTARNLINTLNNDFSDNKTAPDLPTSIYCICDCKDKKRTVIVGCDASNFKRTAIYMLGCFTRENENMQINSLIKRHEKNCTFKSTIKTEVTALYSLKGWVIRSGNHYTIPSSAILEAKWYEASYESERKFLNDAQLLLQIVVGHAESQFYVFWQQLALVQSLIEVLTSGSDLDEVIISKQATNVYEIVSQISSMLMQQGRNIKMHNKKVSINELDMNELRDGDSLDKLWKLLLACENVESLLECMISVFEEVAQNAFLKLKISSNNATSIANILRDLSEGKLAVPNITPAEALKFFIELGIEKIKNDFLFLLNTLNYLNVEKVAENWSTLSDLQINKLETGNAARQTLVASRRTRMTLHRGGIKIDLKEENKKLNYLGNLYAMLEFIHVAQYCNLSEHSSQITVQTIFDKYVRADNTHKSFKVLNETKLCSYQICTDYLESKVKHTLISWNLKMSSRHITGATVTTIIHQTETPVFPKTIFNDYEVPVTAIDEKLYYVTEAIICT